MAQMEDEGVVSMILVGPETSVGTALSILVALLLALIFVAASIMNTLFLVIYWRRPTLRSISNKFIVSLTVLNLLASWVLLPLVVGDAFLQAWENPLLCIAVDATAEFITSASIFATVMIAFDRFYAITKPLHYHMMINRQKSMMMICGSWILALVIAVCGAFDHHSGQSWKVCKDRSNADSAMDTSFWNYHSFFVIINMILSFVIPMTMIFVMYFAICRAAEKNSEKNRRNSLFGNTVDAVVQRKTSRSLSTRSTSSQIVSNIRHRLSNASLFLYKEESRAAKISIAVVVLFFMSWFPYYLTEVLESPLIQVVVPHDVHSMVLVLSLSNAAVSPYMYLYRSKRFKREVRRYFGLNFKSTAKNQINRQPTQYYPRERITFPTNISDKNMKADIKETIMHIHMKCKITNVVPVSTFFNNIIPVHGFGLEPWRSQNVPLTRSSSTTTVSSASYSLCTISSDTIDYSALEKDECLQPLTQDTVSEF